MTLAPAGMAASAPTATILRALHHHQPRRAELAAATVEQVRGLEHGGGGGRRRGGRGGRGLRAGDEGQRQGGRKRGDTAVHAGLPQARREPGVYAAGRPAGKQWPTRQGLRTARLSPLREKRTGKGDGNESIRLDGGARLPARADRLGAGGGGDAVDLAVRPQRQPQCAGALRQVDPAVRVAGRIDRRACSPPCACGTGRAARPRVAAAAKVRWAGCTTAPTATTASAWPAAASSRCAQGCA